MYVLSKMRCGFLVKKSVSAPLQLNLFFLIPKKPHSNVQLDTMYVLHNHCSIRGLPMPDSTPICVFYH
jgi:hypothetical protein